jgi:hypothetical protein
MAGIPRHQGRSEPKLGPSDLSDTTSDRPNSKNTDSDAGGTGERVTVGKIHPSEDSPETGVDRVIDAGEAGLGGGLDQAEEAQLGLTDEELRKRAKQPKP